MVLRLLLIVTYSLVKSFVRVKTVILLMRVHCEMAFTNVLCLLSSACCVPNSFICVVYGTNIESVVIVMLRS